MADKLISLVNTQKYVRHRDIWDLPWLKQRGASPDLTLVKNKLRDYSVEGYTDKACDMISRLPGIIAGDTFISEMTRFLPTETLDRTLHNAKFAEFLSRELSTTLKSVVSQLESPGPETSVPKFRL